LPKKLLLRDNGRLNILNKEITVAAVIKRNILSRCIKSRPLLLFSLLLLNFNQNFVRNATKEKEEREGEREREREREKERERERELICFDYSPKFKCEEIKFFYKIRSVCDRKMHYSVKEKRKEINVKIS